MTALPSILLIDLASSEKHSLNSSECHIGRNWLKCDDKRISRNHGVLKVLTQNSIALISTHENPLFYRKKDEQKINQIDKGIEVNLVVGDSFGLLVDKFWFSIEMPTVEEDSMNGNGTKRRGIKDSTPDSTTKRVKTEPIEDDANDANDANDEHNETVLTNGNENASNNETNHEMPTTSDQSSDIPNNIPASHGPVHRPIKMEPIDSAENEASPVKTEPQQSSVADSTHVPIKTEIKDEPVDDGAAAVSSNSNETAQSTTPEANQSATPTQTPPRECCRYGIRCYRRNPGHRCGEAHPGDADYRLPDYPEPPLGTPLCPFLDRCYRRNPLHFQQFSHKTNLSDQNKKKDGYEATVQPPRSRTNTAQQQDDESEESEQDPFASDGDSDADFIDPGSGSASDDPYDAETDHEGDNE